MFQDVNYSKMGSFSVFNPRYNTPEQIERKYQEILNSSPLPLIKIISNHDFNMIERIFQSNYKTIFIYPEDLRKQILKVMVAKKTDTFVNKHIREKYVGSVVITEDEILERIQFYNTHMQFKDRCDYSFSDRSILDDPRILLNTISLDFMGTRYKYKKYKISDEEMLQNVNEFNSCYNEILYGNLGHS